jgi:hypothetical protein
MPRVFVESIENYSQHRIAWMLAGKKVVILKWKVECVPRTYNPDFSVRLKQKKAESKIIKMKKRNKRRRKFSSYLRNCCRKTKEHQREEKRYFQMCFIMLQRQ